jgi:hypothetical protein
MTYKKFEDFLNEQASEPPVDWQGRLEAWQHEMNSFFERVNTYLQSYIAGGKLELQPHTIKVVEDYLGEYDAPAAEIIIASKKISLRPVGTLIVGARGRIDMDGPRGRVRFVLVGENLQRPDLTDEGTKSKREWKVATAGPRIQYLPLTEQSFLDALMMVTNGPEG